MKVVLFCGGAGMRLRGYSEDVPKPMVTVGSRPVLWHVMKYYAHFGHKDFVVCLGYKGNVIKEYFLEYQESVSNDFVFSRGGRDLEFMQRDIDDWRITFVDTGLRSSIGDRLRLVEPYLKDEEVFLANYSDGLTDFPLPEMIEEFGRRNALRLLYLGSAARQQSRYGRTEKRWCGSGNSLHERIEYLGQRRLLCSQQRCISLLKAGRRAGLRTYAADDRRRQGLVATLRRVLAMHGHL